MFGMFKEKIPLDIVVDGIVEDVKLIHSGIDEFAQDSGINTKEGYRAESVSLSYVLGIVSIQSSTFGANDKHQLSAGLTGRWAKILSNDPLDTRRIPYLQSKIGEYESALENPSSLDEVMQMHLSHLLRNIGENPTDYYYIVREMGPGIGTVTKRLVDQLDDMSRSYKIVY
jgi:hypothetical protein